MIAIFKATVFHEFSERVGGEERKVQYICYAKRVHIRITGHTKGLILSPPFPCDRSCEQFDLELPPEAAKKIEAWLASQAASHSR